MQKVVTMVLTMVLIQNLSGQVSFDRSDHLINDANIRSTLSIGITDMNGDHKDDIVFMDQGTELKIAYQNGENTAFDMVESGNILNYPAWTLSLGDLDNDGINEIFTCGISTYGNIFKQNPNGKYVFSQILYGLTFPQNSNMADINNDGWIDVFVCDERAYNDLYLNDQTGFVVYDDFIDMNTVPVSDNSGNYGSEWVDFDDDGDIDLFITKCKAGIDSPDDPLRLNVLFQNDGLNNYTERAEDYGLKSGAQSWTGSFGDLDNDGDLDCFVSNHDTSHVIYRNIQNDTFVDVSASLIPAIRTASIQAAIRDFDNNGYLDIFVTGDDDVMLWNQGSDQWVVQDDPFGELDVFTFATGDLNDDGFLDLVASYGRLNEPGDYDDVVWLNQSNSNHYLKLSLLGVVSNRKGVGAKIKAYSSLGVQTRDVKIGESYGTTNSSNVHFGLGAVELIDSLIIYWPSGLVDSYYNVLADQHLLVQESRCMSPFTDLIIEGDNILCEGESVELSFDAQFAQYQWSTGETSQSIIIAEESNVSCRAIDENACIHHSNIQKIWYQPDQTPKISFETGAPVNCSDTQVKLISSPAISYEWSDGQTSQGLEVDSSGIYTVIIQGDCELFESHPVEIEFFQVELPIPENDTIWINEISEVELIATGDSIFWYDDYFSNIPIATGNFQTGYIHSDSTFYVSNFKEHLADVMSVGMAEHMGSPFGSNSLNSGLIFNCWDTIIIEQVKVIGELPGYRTFELRQIDETDGSKDLILSRQIFVDEGAQYIDLDFLVEPGLQYVLTTNQDSNLVHFGYQSPMLYRSNQGVAFPYILDDLLEITRSLHGLSYYYYFFDWKIRPISVSCFSEKLAVTIKLDTVSTSLPGEFSKSVVHIYPNPSNQLNVQIDGLTPEMQFNLIIFDQLGQEIKRIKFSKTCSIKMNEYSDGLYFILLEEPYSGVTVMRKFVKRE